MKITIFPPPFGVIRIQYEPGSINSLVLGDGRPLTFNDGTLIMGIINPDPDLG